MIMICNVPDEVVKNVKMGTWCGSSVVEKMIANGIPLDKMREDMLHEIYMAGTNMAGEYKGCWVRFKDIEKIVNEHFKAALETKESEVEDGKEH